MCGEVVSTQAGGDGTGVRASGRRGRHYLNPVIAEIISEPWKMKSCYQVGKVGTGMEQVSNPGRQ